jgi:cytochrome c-type biogenesis protein CcmE
VVHAGDPPELFEPGIPVVLEGRWAASGDHFDSDAIRVKHSEEYEADNGDRLREAEDGEGGAAAAS